MSLFKVGRAGANHLPIGNKFPFEDYLQENYPSPKRTASQNLTPGKQDTLKIALGKITPQKIAFHAIDQYFPEIRKLIYSEPLSHLYDGNFGV